MNTLIVTIAWRSLREHRTKTVIVGALLAIGMLVLVVGNSLMDSAAQGIERLYIRNFTGHLMISGAAPGRLTMFGYQDVTAMDRAIPLVPVFHELLEFLNEQPYTAAASPQGTGFALADVGGEARMPVSLFGIDPAAYQETFPDNIRLTAGRFLEPGETGLLLSKVAADRLNERLDEPLTVGDSLLLTSLSTIGGMRIREVPVVGIYAFHHSNPQLDMVSLVDITTLRALSGMALTRVDPAELSPEQQRIFEIQDVDELFAQTDEFLVDVADEGVAGEQDYLSIFDGDAAGEPVLPDWQDPAAWHFILLRLTDERHLPQASADIQAFFRDRDVSGELADWRQAAGAMADVSFGVRWAFNAVVLVIAVVAVIIIMNTLVISVTQRLSEFGTMRAIGAQKGFIRRMMLWEALLLSAISGAVGVTAGAVLLTVLGAQGIQAPNMFFEIIFGGSVLHPTLSWTSVGVSLALLVVVAVVSSLYPTAIVLKTPPVKAIHSE